MVPLLIIFLILVLVTDTEKTARIDLLSEIYQNFSGPIDRAAATFQIAKSRIISMIAVESSGRTDLPTGSAGEEGLLQVTPPALQDVNRNLNFSYSPEDLRDPATGIFVGVGYLKLLTSQFSGDLDLATQAYNGGSGNVKKNPAFDLAYLDRVKMYENLLPQNLV